MANKPDWKEPAVGAERSAVVSADDLLALERCGSSVHDMRDVINGKRSVDSLPVSARAIAENCLQQVNA